MTEKKLIQTLLIDDDPFFVVVFSDLGKKMESIELTLHHTVSLEDSIKDALEHYQAYGKATGQGEESILKELALKRSLNGVSIMDREGYISYVNPSFVTMFGYGSEEEIVGRNMEELTLSPGEFDEVLAVLRDKKVWLGELAGIKKDKVEINMQTLFSLIEYKELKPPEIMASFIDITKLKDAEKKRESLYRGIMEVFALKAEEVGNVETAGHIRRIAEYTHFVADELKKQEPFKNYIDDKYVSDISYASMLHDVGKWRTPNEILLKPFQLSEAEWGIIKQHPKLGVDMLMPLLKDKGSNQYLRLIESIVLYHHERWDGSGYPEGLKGEEIPLSARIVALADTYDALVSDRSYRKGYSHEQAVEIIRKEEHKLDPRVWQIFMDNHSEFKRLKDKSSSVY